jgi:tetratricopeptide (TPR) repeat protein
LGIRQKFAVPLAVAVLLATATPALAQMRRIQGKVVDAEGSAVAGAAIDVTLTTLADADFAVRHNDQIWRARTNATGDYIVTVPSAGEYVVTAAKDGMGRERTKVVVQRSGLVTANLTLWNPPATIVAAAKCGTGRSIGERSRLAAAGADPSLVRLLEWLEAVHLHTPGCGDSPAIEVGGWTPRDLEVMIRDVRELVRFLQRARYGHAERTGQDVDRRGQATFAIYGRQFTLDDLERRFYGNQPLVANELLRRAAVLHADIGIFVQGTFGRYPLVEDGGRRGWQEGSWHWEVGRLLLDTLNPSAREDADALQWYRAVAAHLFRRGNLAQVANHLNRARQVFPQSPNILIDSAYLHLELSSPPVQASLQQLRADGVNVTVASRRTELERAERFLREALILAPADADARLRLGYTLGELGRSKEAAIELRMAIDAKPDRRGLYLAALFLGRAEEALGRRDEARRRYEHAVDLFPGAQSPRLALSGLARHTGDRASAQRSLHSLASISDAEASDPWWGFYQAHDADADVLIGRMREMGR